MKPHSKINYLDRPKEKLALLIRRLCMLYRKAIFSIHQDLPEIIEFEATDAIVLGKTPTFLKWSCRNATLIEIEGVGQFLKNTGYVVVYPIGIQSSYTLIAHGIGTHKKANISLKHIEVHLTGKPKRFFPTTIISEHFNSRDFSRRMIYPAVKVGTPIVKQIGNAIYIPPAALKKQTLQTKTEEYQPILFEL